MDEQNNLNLNKKSEAIHTYAGDMASMVRDNEASVIKIAMAEQRRREAEVQKDNSRKQKNYALMFAIFSIILIFGAIYIYKYLNQKGKIEATHTEIVTEIPTLIPDDIQTLIPSNTIAGREDLVRVIAKAREDKKAGLIESIFLTSGGKQTLSSTEFLDLVGSSIPNAFERSLSPDFMIGLYRPVDGTKIGTFFIFKSSSYDQAVAGSYAWEKTLLDEFSTIFGVDISGENKILLQKSFEDTIIYNTDARVLYGTNNEPLFYSLFLNQNLYMLTDSKDVIVEAIKRLRTQNAKPL
ncbi:hypothetical protein IT400_03460 [Candidatus Nomurabacteria bacterium]|nr:hypothetical protein [Candidatus Nomurabacteria bacterium]